MGAPLTLLAAARRLVAAATLAALLPAAAAAQGTPAAEQERAHADAQAEYEVGHYAAAYAAFATLADAGHAESARVALQMYRYGPGLFRMRFAAGPQQIGHWTGLVACRDHPVVLADTCAAAAAAQSAARH